MIKELDNSTVDQIEVALDITLYPWQRERLLGRGGEIPSGRAVGRTTLRIIQLCFVDRPLCLDKVSNQHRQEGIDYLDALVDIPYAGSRYERSMTGRLISSMTYFRWYVGEFLKIWQKLIDVGLPVTSLLYKGEKHGRNT